MKNEEITCLIINIKSKKLINCLIIKIYITIRS